MNVDLLSVRAEPNSWPLLGPTNPASAALIVIDMQVDFVREGGWFGQMGFDVSDIQRAVPVMAQLLSAARAVPGFHVIHTRQGNAADLSDLPATRQEQGRRTGFPIGHAGPFGRGLIRGESGWRIVDELAPNAEERIVDKPGYDAFIGTDLRGWLDDRGVRSLILTGVTANVCVLSTLLAAVDLGYDCSIVADAVGAADQRTRETVLDLVRYQGGLLGSIATSADVIAAFRTISNEPDTPT